jgi:alkylhydroperoxidase family enzyme
VQQQGLTEDKLTRVARYEQDEDFTETERQALRYAEVLISHPEGASDELFDTLREHFSEGEIVEIAFAVMVFAGLHRFHTAIALDAPAHIVLT